MNKTEHTAVRTVLVVAGLLSLALGSAVAEAQTDVLYVANNRVGIGTATPGGLLDIHDGDPLHDTFAGMGVDLVSGPAFNYGYAGATYGRSAGFFNVRPDASAVAPNPSLRFMTANSLRMIISNTGYVGIGISPPSYPLHMGSGAYVTVGGVWTNASSRAYKDNIQELSADEAIETLQGLAPVTYTYKADPGEQHVGFIAEDAPALVATPDRKGMSPMDVTAVLTKVVQEQQKTAREQKKTLQEQQRTIEELRMRIEGLENRK